MKSESTDPGGGGTQGSTACFPLPLASVGQTVRIEVLSGGRGMVQRLTSMGLYVGAEVTVFNRGNPGPVIVSYGGMRLAIGYGMARKLRVSPVSARGSRPGKSDYDTG